MISCTICTMSCDHRSRVANFFIAQGRTFWEKRFLVTFLLLSGRWLFFQCLSPLCASVIFFGVLCLTLTIFYTKPLVTWRANANDYSMYASEASLWSNLCVGNASWRAWRSPHLRVRWAGHVQGKVSVCKGFASVSKAGKWVENICYCYYSLFIQYKYFIHILEGGFLAITS